MPTICFDAIRRLRFENAALLALQGELLKARMLSGDLVDTHLLIEIDEAICAILPAKPYRLEIEYIDPPMLCARCKVEIPDEPKAAAAEAAAAAAAAAKGCPVVPVSDSSANKGR